MFHFRRDYADHDNVTVREQDILPPHELLVTRTMGEMDTSSSFSKEEEAVTSDTIEVSQMSPPISALLFPSWQLRFFIRADLGGFFHAYPHVGGPFRIFGSPEFLLPFRFTDIFDSQLFSVYPLLVSFRVNFYFRFTRNFG